MSGEGETTLIERIGSLPLFVVALHRLARLGKGTLYAPSKRFVKFAITDELASKWVPLRDAASVILIYRDQEVK